MSLRESLEIFRQLDVPIKEMRVSGGGAKSTLWKQILADVMHQPACTMNAEQGPAFGVALLAAVGAGEFKNIEEACKATIEVTAKTVPQRAAVKTLDRSFEIYRSLYGSLKETYAAISRLP